MPFPQTSRPLDDGHSVKKVGDTMSAMVDGLASEAIVEFVYSQRLFDLRVRGKLVKSVPRLADSATLEPSHRPLCCW
jgi:hypothetical protein